MNLFTKTPFRRHSIHLSRAAIFSFPSTNKNQPPRSFINLNKKQPYSSSYKAPPRMPPSPTFQLWEFSLFGGCDMHVLVLLQQTSNQPALANLRHNLRHSIASGAIKIWPREYSLQDVVNIQTSAVDLIKLFEGTNDNVDLFVASGKLAVGLNEAAAETVADEASWFEDVFASTKFPKWDKLGGNVVSMLEEEFDPEGIESEDDE
jgi:hypothetical protein